VITEDVRNVSEALKQQAIAQERRAREAQERNAELALAQKDFETRGSVMRE
jgi:hypothetical protein